MTTLLRDAAAATRTAAGRLIPRRCTHPAGWSRSRGVERCHRCGTERHTDYATLRMPTPGRAPGPAWDWGCPRLGAPGARPAPGP
ncbi:DUF6255 family natural product biosynthesis protein [Streptomyces roseoverticillatus]|uniref:DUF6255 family natural product biosynthesis protein n=1 Tax=Streptomyces roseoverticillatus TaxID=66429 RepID=UPI00378DED8B